MAVRELQAKVVRDRPQPVLLQVGQQQAGQFECVVRRPEDLYALAREERRIERWVLADDGVQPDELFDLRRDRTEVRRAIQRRRIDVREHLDAVLELAVGIYERVIRV